MGPYLKKTWKKKRECTIGKPQGGAMIPGKVICWALLAKQKKVSSPGRCNS